MLDSIRNNSRSFGVKIIFGAIILVFLFWGVGNFSGGSVSSVAQVNGEAISIQDFGRVFSRVFESERSRSPDFAGNAEDLLRLKRRVLEEMIFAVLWRQEAERLGLFISPHELLADTAGLSVFQDASGKFDRDRYQSILAARGITAGQYEAGRRRELLVEKMQRYVLMSAAVSEEEARAYFDFGLEGRRAGYVLFPLEDYLDKAEVSAEDVAAFYADSPQIFRTDPELDLTYLPLTPALLAAGYEVSEEETAAYYADKASSFALPARYKVRHIFLEVPEKAPEDAAARAEARMAEILARLKAGGDFAALAGEFSEDDSSKNAGGDLGWLEEGRIALPGVEEALAGLSPGEISGVLASPFGRHLFKLEDKAAAARRPLDEVRAEIRETLALRKAEADFPAVQQAAEDALNLGLSFEELARRFKVEVRRTGLVDEFAAMDQAKLQSGARKLLQDAVSGLASPAGEVSAPAAPAANASAAAPGGEALAPAAAALAPQPAPLVLPVPLEIVDGIALVAVEQAKPARIRPLDEVRGEIVDTLKREAALRLARAAAAEARPGFAGEAAPEDFRSRLAESAAFSRAMPVVPGLEGSESLARSLLSSLDGAWLPGVHDTAGGAVIARVAEVIPARDEDWLRLKETFLAQFREHKANELALAFLQNLVAGADIVQPEGILEQLRYR
ncbi:MAG: SurA N-terminal domain-containing protein [Desulfovibrio sp.]|jgi:peptidyl-prolyl cis-trans isomerase D|nr:SurA N-terminal domain-containing protein [Desulfovibrio sp.]